MAKSIPVGKAAAGLAITPSGKTLYVANYYSGTISTISTATNKAGKTITACTTGLTCQPQHITITPNGKTAYVSNGANEATAIYAIHTATNTASTITVGGAPAYLTLTPGGGTLYVSATGASQVVPVTTSTDKVGKPISLAAGAGQLAAMPARLTISTRSLKAGKTRKSYRDQLVAAGGVGAYSWKVSAGKLPKGLKLSKSGLISGKPAKKETVSFTVRVTDPSGVTATEKLKLKIT